MRGICTRPGYPTFPTTLAEFQRRFSTERSCRDYLVRVRWPEGFACSRCGGTQAWVVGLRRLRCRACRQTVWLTAGTILHGSHLPLRTWFWTAYLMSTLTPGISAWQLYKLLGVGSYETALRLTRRLRRAMVNPLREPLRGVVEVDDAYVGGPERGKRGVTGRGVRTKIPIVVAVENRGDHAGRMRVQVIPDVSEESLSAFIQRHIAPGSQVNTDGWWPYRHLDARQYHHRPKVQGTPARAGKILPWVHRVTGNLKTWLRGTHHGRVTRPHLQEYLEEFTFRFNRRRVRESAFLTLLMLATQLKPATEAVLPQGRSSG